MSVARLSPPPHIFRDAVQKYASEAGLNSMVEIEDSSEVHVQVVVLHLDSGTIYFRRRPTAWVVQRTVGATGQLAPHAAQILDSAQ